MKKIMVIGAHPDDCDFSCGGIALKLLKEGIDVKFLSMTNGGAGHHLMNSDDLIKRRIVEMGKVSEITGIIYDVWADSKDGELVASIENRKRLVCEIRNYKPDVIICNRLNDYHPDHRNASQLVQDASYMLIVPLFVPEVPALDRTPIIMHSYDGFKNPEFHPDVVIDIDDVIVEKFKMTSCHESQVYEWLPYASGIIDNVPESAGERFEWLCSPEQKRNIKAKNASDKYREFLIQRYGKKGETTVYSEAFEISEYGRRPDENELIELFPF